MSKDKEFPFKCLYKLQDQMDEIVDIDTNYTLDMYVTLSKDGTIALRCMRTSQLYQHFLLFNKQEKQDKNDKNKKKYEIITGYSKIFGLVHSLKLSKHGYIVIVGKSPVSNVARYIVFSINGDFLQSVDEKY